MSLTFSLKVIPQSGKQRFIWDHKQSIIKCYLKSIPDKNKANNELSKFLSKTLGIPLNSIAIITGQTSHRKTFKIEAELSFEQMLEGIGVLVQQSVC